jgi:hypothetical protein
MELQMYQFENIGNKVELKPDGLLKVTSTGGSSMTVDKDGRRVFELKDLKAVSIQNIVDIASYSITHVAGMTSHFAKYVDGGQLEFAYDKQGNIVSFTTKGLQVILTPQNFILVGRVPT